MIGLGVSMEDPPAGLVVDFDGVLDLEALGGVLLRALRRILVRAHGLLMHLGAAAAGAAGGGQSALRRMPVRAQGLLMHLDAAGVAGGAWSALSAVRYVGVAALERVEQ